MTDNFLDTLKGLLLGIIACAIISLFLSSCKTHQSVVSERVVYDTVWTTKVVHDSINGTRVEKEITRIVPHVLRLKDTTIVYCDTTIINNVDGKTIVYKDYYQDKGEVSRDSANIKEKVIPKDVKIKDTSSKWRRFWYGIIVGVLVTLCITKRKKIGDFIKCLLRFS